jgi:hypothetical protein
MLYLATPSITCTIQSASSDWALVNNELKRTGKESCGSIAKFAWRDCLKRQSSLEGITCTQDEIPICHLRNSNQ